MRDNVSWRAASPFQAIDRKALKLIFVNRFFHPDHSATSQMLSDLAFGLAGRGHSVSVITSRQLYDGPDEPLPDRETVAGVDVHRVWASRFGRRYLLGRSVDYLTFYLSAAWRLWRLARRAYGEGNYEPISARCAEGSGELIVETSFVAKEAKVTLAKLNTGLGDGRARPWPARTPWARRCARSAGARS